MNRRVLVVVAVLLAISIAAFVYYLTHRTPGGIEIKGSDRIGSMASLATSTVSLATAFVTLVTTLRKSRRGEQGR